jgi:hypothetical protein
MSNSEPHVWADEIRAYLLGRLSKGSTAHKVRSVATDGPTASAIRRWWVLEGKHYPALGGPLVRHFCRVRAMAEQLASSFNPRQRLSERPEGEVDWPLTLLRRGGSSTAEYVVRGSSAGLDEAEYSALVGWLSWIQAEYARHAQYLGESAECFETPLLNEGVVPRQRLEKWALVTRRSRWPLLRGVVAESIRPYLEDEEFDRIPLPSDPTKLFELLCLVRIARHFVARPRSIRWLELSSSNAARFDDLTCRYQEPLSRGQVLQAEGYAGGLAEAVQAFGVGVPQFIDVAVDFASPIRGFAGVLVEAKSGSQPYQATVAQLRTYRSARGRRPGARYVVWGVVKEPCGTSVPVDAVRHMLDVTAPDQDLWLFSTADDIPIVLDAVFGASPSSSNG